MPYSESEDELADEPRDKTAVDYIDDILEELEQDERSFAFRNRRQAREINDELNSLELVDFHDEGLERAQNGVVNNPAEAVADTGDSSAAVIDQLRKQLETATRKLAKAPPARKTYNLQRFLGIFGVGVFLVGAANLIYMAIHNAQQNQPPPPPLPPDTAAKVRELVREWNSERDAKYWEDLASYVSLTSPTVPLTLADQVLFMNYTVDLSPAGAAWIWDNGQDVEDLVNQLVAAYNSKQTTAAMYQLAATLPYKNQPIPRPVMAGLLRYALSKLIVLATALRGAGRQDEEPLSDPPDDERTAVDDEVAEARSDEQGFAARIEATATQITQSVTSLEASTLNCDSAQGAWSIAVDVSNSAVADTTANPRLDALQGAVDHVMSQISKNRDGAKTYSVSRYLAAFIGLGVLGAAAVVLFEYLSRSATNRSTDDITPVPEDTLQKIRDLVISWRAENDAAFWEDLAAYLDKNPGALTLADQVVFMNYTIQLCPPAVPFLWDHAKDKADIADQLVATSNGGKSLAAMYRSLKTLTYDEAPLPRAVAADVARLALAWIASPASPRLRRARPRPARRPPGDPAAGPRGGAITRIPDRLAPRVYVAEVSAGTDRAAYARMLHDLLAPPRNINLAALAAAHTYEQPETCPYVLGEVAAALAALPAAAQAQVRELTDQMRTVVEGTYPVPVGETIQSSTLTYVAAAGGGLAPGTVVYVRRTNRAMVYFALPHIVIDVATGAPSLVGLGPVPHAPRLAPTGAGLGGGAASIALSVASNLVWVLPPPWGPIAAGGLTLIQLLLSPDAGPDPFGLAVQRLEQFIQERDVNNDATHIKGLADWLQGQTYTLSATQVDNSAYITSVLLPELHKMVAPGDESVYNAVYDLENNLSVPGAFDILVLGVTIYLLTLKMIIQLDAQLASTARNAGDDMTFATYTDVWLADYVNFLTAVNGYTQQGVTIPGWAVKMANHVNDFINARLGQITQPYRFNNQQWVVVTGGGSTGTSGNWVDNWGWTFKDNGAGDSDTTHFVGDTFTGGDCCHDATRVEHADVVQQARNAYADAISDQLDTQYRDTIKTIKQWVASIQQWNQHLPPRPPTSAPTVTPGTGALPNQDWVQGAAVAYAAAFANQAGPSQVGPWSAFTPITTTAFATLSNLPTDPLQAATNRWIYRQFRRPDGTTTPIRIIDITDAKVATYNDTKP